MSEARPVETAETLAVVRCVECGRLRERDEIWLLYFADTGEVTIYCPDCAEREFGGDDPPTRELHECTQEGTASAVVLRRPEPVALRGGSSRLA
jgi:hypothetical protein